MQLQGYPPQAHENKWWIKNQFKIMIDKEIKLRDVSPRDVEMSITGKLLW